MEQRHEGCDTLSEEVVYEFLIEGNSGLVDGVVAAA